MVVGVPVAAQAALWDASAVIGRVVEVAAGALAFHAIGGSVQFGGGM